MLVANGIDEFLTEAPQAFPNARDFSFNHGDARGEENCTYHNTPSGTVRVRWTQPPTEQQLSNISTKLVDAVKPLANDEKKRRHRIKVVASIASEPVMQLFEVIFEYVYEKIADIERDRGKPVRPLEEIKAELLDRFVNGRKSKK